MKVKRTFYLIVGIVGIALMVASVVLDSRVSDALDGTLMGVGAALTGVGISMWRYYSMEKKDPAKWKRQEIETRDERNVAIRNRAKAVAGEVLQWTVLVGAWIAAFVDVPLWVPLACVGVFLGKTILELWLTARYQKIM